MSDIPADPAPLDLREQLTRIDQMHADIQHKLAQAARVRQEIRMAPWLVAATGAGAGAALFAAGAAFIKLLG